MDEYESQLEQIAGEVDSYIVKTDGSLEYFRAQIRPLAQRWKTYYEAVDKRKKELLHAISSLATRLLIHKYHRS